MIRGVLFDLDNTLIDFLRMKRMASHEAARAMIEAGADFGVDADPAGDLLYQHYLEHGIESDDAFASFLAKHNRARLAYGQSRNEKMLASGVQTYLRAKELFLTPYPAVRKALVDLTRRQLRLGVLTDAPRLKAWQRLVAVGLAEFFDVVVTSEDTSARKPSAAAFRAAVEALDLKPYEILMIGDWPERDIVGAKELGLKTAFAAYGGRTVDGDHGADAVLNSMDELIPLLEEWKQR